VTRHGEGGSPEPPTLCLAAFATSSYSDKMAGTAIDPLIGTDVAGYRVETLIGRGGMSVVYLAEHLSLGRRVALKVLAPELARDARFRERFLRESRLAASLEHPNVLPIHDAGEFDGLLFIAMRHVEGRDLRSLLDEEGRLEPERALSLIGQVADALDLAHARGLVHRDVTPGNILVADRDHAYLADFGLSRLVASSVTLTETGQLLGTLDYVAPEQIEGLDADGRADVYSLTCVLYECLTGAPPFARNREIAVLWAHVQDPPPAPSEACPGLPAALDEVVARGLAKRPDDRVARCSGLVAAARAALDAPGGLPARGPATEGQARQARKTVTVLFFDVRGPSDSAELIDPELLRQGIETYSEEAAAVLESHGGTVERFAGGAFVAVFGAPVAHEDDALRAVRAAVELRQRLERLNGRSDQQGAAGLVAHFGVDTGEAVITDQPAGRPEVVGDVVNLAVRLGQAAEPDEILLGETTYRLTAEAVAAEERTPAPVDGARGGSRAWRVLELLPAAPPLQRRAGAPMIGRDAELRVLRHAFEQAVAERACRVVNVIGPPGIGKSRLAAALAESLAGEATVLAGRCLSYGEGITYWPIAEIVRAAAGDDVRSGLARLLAATERRTQIAERVAATIGLAEASGAGEETFWAVRRLFETLARSRPLVLCFEDVHWAEPTLLDLLEHMTRKARDAPMLLVCLARPDLLDARPEFRTMPGSVTLELQPLSEVESSLLVDRLRAADRLSQELTRRIVEVAEGNPLFLEQLLAMASEEASSADRLALPPAIQAVLSARLDRLPGGERHVIECASIEGLVFHMGPLAALCSAVEGAALWRQVLALTRKELVRPARSDVPGDEALRFQHALIREAAYQGIAKERRAELHERFGEFLERTHEHAPTALELEEIVGYHLEQAVRYRHETGTGRDSDRALAERASARLQAAGRRALARVDLPAAINLLERAAALLSGDSPERALLDVDRAAALADAGRLEEADALLGAVETRTPAERRVAANADVQRLLVRYSLDLGRALEDLHARGEALGRALELENDDRGLCRLWRLHGLARWAEGSVGSAEQAWERALAHARRAGDRVAELDVLCWLASAAFFGPLPARAGIERCEEILGHIHDQPYGRAQVLRPLAGLQAMTGHFDTAAALLAEANALLAEVGLTMDSAMSHPDVLVAALKGDLPGAERLLRAGYARLEAMGEQGVLTMTAALLTRVLSEQGKDDEALAWAETTRQVAAARDVAAQAIWRGVRARILARRGALGEAVALAREAVALISRTDHTTLAGDALLDLAEVLDRAGSPEAAVTAAREALASYERKGHEVAAARARRLVDSAARR
jgi:class 3 adenylate cyclase/tRNA A-37 threonylcarbamoyl transferase component Bud32/tetratricopeptide (TPR) repeat protein